MVSPCAWTVDATFGINGTFIGVCLGTSRVSFHRHLVQTSTSPPKDQTGTLALCISVSRPVVQTCH